VPARSGSALSTGRSPGDLTGGTGHGKKGIAGRGFTACNRRLALLTGMTAILLLLALFGLALRRQPLQAAIGLGFDHCAMSSGTLAAGTGLLR
jgi:hypothetical protein